MQDFELDYSKLSDNTPVLIGSGQHVEHISEGMQPPFSSPAQLAATAATRALEDSGATDAAQAIDTIAFVRLFSDSAFAWESSFGSSNNLPESVATRIGAQPSHRIYSNVGGNQPLQLLAELAGAIHRGEKSLVLLAGAEAIAYQKYGRRNELKDDWEERYDLPLDSREYNRRFVAPQEIQSGMRATADYYSLIENHQAHSQGRNAAEQREFMAGLFAPFSRIAANNPYAQFRTAYNTAELATEGVDNYAMTIPYTKRFVAQDAVNQGAAVLVASVGQARSMGIPQEHWIFIHGYGEGTDRFLFERPDPGKSEAMRQVINRTMEAAGLGNDEIDLLDIYSCFPSAVTAVCDVLSLPTDGSKDLTVTGGLPFFGGPGNNYSLHAIAEMAAQLRGQHRHGLITANGGILTKHAALVLSDLPRSPDGRTANWDEAETPPVEEADLPRVPACDNPATGRVISYTVAFKRGKPDVGVVLAETEQGERFLASTTDAEMTASMRQTSPIGRNINVTEQEQRQIFTFQEEIEQQQDAAV